MRARFPHVCLSPPIVPSPQSPKPVRENLQKDFMSKGSNDLIYAKLLNFEHKKKLKETQHSTKNHISQQFTTFRDKLRQIRTFPANSQPFHDKWQQTNFTKFNIPHFKKKKRLEHKYENTSNLTTQHQKIIRALGAHTYTYQNLFLKALEKITSFHRSVSIWPFQILWKRGLK